eukprot:c3852_g1_i1 orf=176-700(+)
MANQAAKKRRDENVRHIRFLQRLILASNAIFVVVRLLILHSSFTWKHWIGLLVTSGAYKLIYDQLAGMAKATFDENGELVDGGFDMTQGGLCSYLHDVLYITVFVQLTSIVSDKFWFVYLVIPIFALYKLWKLVLHPYIFQSSSEEAEDEKAKRKREKMERKAARPKFAKSRNR